MITTFNISLVVHGTIAENMDYAKEDSMAMGIYHRLESPLDITTSSIIRRIVANHEAYQVTNVIRRLCMQHLDSSTVHILR
ncbi:hypothetical protein HU200_049989 [Digitaria exilis]|uniref:Uncharacterized protein n=1 Tax=Digitaria exilis TaxID=1010633 RepID=A0A835AU22_9POAL|nr:hypothetical protein HU200_049989 [Digitaria exilis]